MHEDLLGECSKLGEQPQDAKQLCVRERFNQVYIEYLCDLGVSSVQTAPNFILRENDWDM